MDNQEPQPLSHTEPTTAQPVAAPAPVPAVTAAPQQTERPTLAVSDEAAQALLAINNLQTAQKQKARLPMSLIISVLVVIVLVVLASVSLGKLKSSSDPTKPGAASQSGNAGSKVDSQINQDVSNCTNVVNAISEC